MVRTPASSATSYMGIVAEAVEQGWTLVTPRSRCYYSRLPSTWARAGLLYSLFSAVSVPSPKRKSNPAHLTLALMTFYVQTWEEYHTHTLTLGLISGPVEGILTLCVVYALTAVKGGGHFWHQSAFKTFGVEKHSFIPKELYDLQFTEWYIIYGGMVLVYNTISRYFIKNVMMYPLTLINLLTETAINAHSQSKIRKHKRNLVDPSTQRARPAKADPLLEPRPH